MAQSRLCRCLLEKMTDRRSTSTLTAVSPSWTSRRETDLALYILKHGIVLMTEMTAQNNSTSQHTLNVKNSQWRYFRYIHEHHCTAKI